MNSERLKQAESNFLAQHPKGFADESLVDVMKRHSKPNLTEFCQENFTPECYSQVDQTVEHMVKCVSRSSMVSMFEKPKFRDFCGRLDRKQRAFLVDSLIDFLHGDQAHGFTGMVDLLRTEKIAKWSLMTIIPAYFAPNKEVFVKPTTAKGILAYLEIDDPVYKPQPTWDFYQKYRALINDARTQVDASLSPSNAAFTGFLMMSI